MSEPVVDVVDVVPVPDTNEQTGLLLSALEYATSWWAGELSNQVPEEMVRWQPFPESHSIGALILHMADVEAYWIQEVGAGKERSATELKTLLSDETEQFAVRWPTPPDQPLSWYLAQHRTVRERTRQTVLALGDPLHQSVGGNVRYTLRWLLSHVATHEAYHSGQIVFLSLLYPHRVQP